MHPGRFADNVCRRLHGKINKERQKRGLKPLKGRKPLIEAATEHSRVMARKDELFHNGPDGSPQSRAPTGYKQVSENCAMVRERGSTGKAAEELLNKWLNSTGHRRNMLRPESRYDGLGVWVKGSKVYATHLMAQEESFLRNRKIATKPVTYPVTAAVTYPVRRLRQLVSTSINRTTPPYTVRERQAVYGTLFGAVAFILVSVCYSWTIHPTGPTVDPGGLLEYYTDRRVRAFRQADVAAPRSVVRYLLSVPTMIIVLAALLCADSVSQSRRLRHLIENTFPAGIVYTTLTGVAVFVISANTDGVAVAAVTVTAFAGSCLAASGLWMARHMPN